MSGSTRMYEISDIEKRTIEGIKKHFTSKNDKFIFRENGYSLIFPDSKFTKFANLIKNLTHLKHIDLRNNQLTKIPEEIKNLVGLTSLDLGENQIKEIPAWIEDLKNLEYLSLYGNQIKEIPPVIEKLPYLRDLDLSYNPISTIKNIYKSDSLYYLSCNFNLIENFENVDIDHNKIHFEFFGNPINSFHSVPKLSLIILLQEIRSNQDTYNYLNLSKTGQKLLKDLLHDLKDDHWPEDFFVDENETREENVPLEKFERFYNFYKKHTDKILQDLIGEKTVSLEEMERLVHESGLIHRHLLENSLPKDHPIFELYNEEYSVRCESGLKILI